MEMLARGETGRRSLKLADLEGADRKEGRPNERSDSAGESFTPRFARCNLTSAVDLFIFAKEIK